MHPSRSPPPPLHHAPPPGGGCPDPGAILDAHNTYRDWHQAQPLRWDENLAEGCRRWAQHLADTTCELQHDSSGFGENL